VADGTVAAQAGLKAPSAVRAELRIGTVFSSTHRAGFIWGVRILHHNFTLAQILAFASISHPAGLDMLESLLYIK
jgi:hypothetical protein